MKLLRAMVVSGCLAAALLGTAQTVRLSGTVQAGQPYRHPIGRGLLLEVKADGIAVRPVAGTAAANFAACATPPAHGPNPLDIEAWHFDPARSEAAPGLRRVFRFALTADTDHMECASAEASFNPNEVPGYRAHPLGTGVLTLSRVALRNPGEVGSFDFTAVVRLPRHRHAKR